MIRQHIKLFWKIICLISVATMLFASGCNRQKFKKAEYSPPEADLALYAKDAKPDHLTLARQLIDKGYYDVALGQLLEEEELNGFSAETRYLVGLCEHKEKNYKEAEKAFREAIKHDADFAAAHDGLGLTLFASGKQNEAMEQFQHAVALDPGRADFQNNLGQAYLMENKLPEAEKHFRKSIALMPGYSLALNNLGFCLCRQGREPEALKTFQRVLSTGEAYNNLGIAYESIGERNKALAMYKKALRESPDLIQAQQNVARLEKEVFDHNRKTDDTATSESNTVSGLVVESSKPVVTTLSNSTRKGTQP